MKTKSFDIDLVQFVKMNNYADTNWAISLPNRISLKEEFEGVVNKTSNTSLSI